jgi:protein bicaudal D
LKKIAETQMEEALQALQSESEAKYALKKELDGHINRESMYNISNLAYSIRGMDDGVGGSDLDGDIPTLKRLEADLSNELKSPDVTAAD